MVAINVFMSPLPLVYSAIVAVLFMILLIRVQINLKPYKYEMNNKLEIEAIITGTATLFCGVLFVSDDNSLALVVLFILLVIIILNVRFIMFWAFCFTFTLAAKYKTCHSVFMMIAVGKLFNENSMNEIMHFKELFHFSKTQNLKFYLYYLILTYHSLLLIATFRRKLGEKMLKDAGIEYKHESESEDDNDDKVERRRTKKSKRYL